MNRTALFISPHLDDVVFSCGGTLAALADRGWRTVMVTAFTATVLPVEGFALACQLDKGLSPDVDYMALRRAEDREAAGILGVNDLRWLGLPEAPHRGYGSAPELFAALHGDDDVWRPLAAQLRALLAELRPDQVFAPQGLGSHVDHRQTIRAVTETASEIPVAWYRDTPYAIRNPAAAPLVDAPAAATLPIGDTLARKIAAACAYRSQVGFQFGGPSQAAAALAKFTARERGERFSGKLDCGIAQP